jgi:hypothetical protein
MSDNWFAKKLAEMRGQPAPPVQQPGYYPPGPPERWSPPGQQVVVIPTHQHQQFQQGVVDTPLPADEHGQVHVWDAVQRWRGGRGTKTETAACPQCGGNNFFSRKNAVTRGHAPAPLCYDCGYNGLFEQFGNSDAEFRG